MAPGGFDSGCLIDILPIYYRKLFPASLMYRWLSHGSAECFSHREFSFTLAGDVYIRYQSFNDDKDFLAELVKRKPEKIDIGAVYNQRPRSRDTLKDFIPQKKEFVLDIDLTDYDDVRTCCQGATVCSKCWKFIAVAVEIMDGTLREDFGFRHILWVFSGRRGVHCWVCDDVAFNMESAVRSAMLEYLSVIRGGESQVKKVKIPNCDRIHPFIKRSLDVIDRVFENICHEDQSMLEKGDKNFEMLPPEVKQATMNATDRFEAVMEYINANKKEKKTVRAALSELKLQLVFPRLDVNVSKDLNHLLKSPFCIHPKTGQVCVPFDPKEAFEFQPSEVPSIMQLLDDIDKSGKITDASGTESKEKMDFKDTSLAPYMKVFENFVKKLEEARKINNGATGKHATDKSVSTMEF